MSRALLLLLWLPWIPACACSTDVDLGEGRDTGLDAHATQRLDECGNGLDDDANGAIDDGCPCAPGETQRCFSGALSSNEVGACQAGTQTCAAIDGSEWGDWGLSGCEGEVLPGTEACDGADADCDGAIDEGCPCTGGDTRSCGDEFVIAPCMAGTQTCRSGMWSTCEGAVGPSADVCGDETDNDCDGLTDEMCECPYPPAPERCRDGVDNDCDGETDEPECTPDWPGDAGVPVDAPARDDVPIDAGGAGCIEAPTTCLARPGSLDSVPGATSRTTLGAASPLLATDGTNLFALEVTSAFEVRLLILDGTGGLIREVLVESGAGAVGDLEWTGTGLVAAWTTRATPTGPATSARYALFDADGSMRAPAAAIDARTSTGNPLVGVLPDGFYFAWTHDPEAAALEDAHGWVQRRGADGTPAGAAVDLGPGSETWSIAPVGDGVVVGTRRFSGTPALAETRAQVHRVEHDLLLWTHTLPPGTYVRADGPAVAASCARVLVCWRELLNRWGDEPAGPMTEQCRVLDYEGVEVATLEPVGAGPWFGNLTQATQMDVIWADGQFLLRSEALYSCDPRACGMTRSESFTSIAPDGSINWTGWSPEDRMTGFSYEYGETAWTGTCAVTLSVGRWTGALPSAYGWQMRRTCSTSC